MSVRGHQSKICFVESGFCYWLNQYPPIHWEPFVEEIGATGYTGLLSDANLVNTIHKMMKGISDGATRAALESGVAAAVEAMEKRGSAQKIKITIAD